MSRIPEEHQGKHHLAPPNTLPPEIVSFPLGNTDSYHFTANVTQTATDDGINIVPARSSARVEPRSNNNRGRCPRTTAVHILRLSEGQDITQYLHLVGSLCPFFFFRCALEFCVFSFLLFPREMAGYVQCALLKTKPNPHRKVIR